MKKIEPSNFINEDFENYLFETERLSVRYLKKIDLEFFYDMQKTNTKEYIYKIIKENWL